MSEGPPPAPLRASDDFLAQVMQSTDGTTYSRGIRADLELMGIRLTRDSDIASVKRVIDETLKSPSVNVLRRLRDTATNDVENVDIRIDPVTRDFIEMRGCSVPGVLMAYRLAQDVDLVADDLDRPVSVEIVWRHGGKHLELQLDLAPDIVWQTGRVRLLKGMPATWANIVIGRRMSDVVAHPLLDRHGMTVIDWDGVDLRVEYDGDSTTVLPREGGTGTNPRSHGRRRGMGKDRT